MGRAELCDADRPRPLKSSIHPSLIINQTSISGTLRNWCEKCGGDYPADYRQPSYKQHIPPQSIYPLRPLHTRVNECPSTQSCTYPQIPVLLLPSYFGSSYWIKPSKPTKGIRKEHHPTRPQHYLAYIYIIFHQIPKSIYSVHNSA